MLGNEFSLQDCLSAFADQQVGAQCSMETLVAQVKLGIELMAAEGVLEAPMANTLLGWPIAQPPQSSTHT